jgi:hypothetical protein
MSPKLTNLLDYTTSWQKWWRELQPKWRLLADGTLSREVPNEGEEWEMIYRGGANGFFMIVLTLSWWVAALDGHVDEELRNVLDDITWVVGHLVDLPAMTGECTGEKRA